MIKVRLVFNRDDILVRMTVNGHSKAGTVGNNVICAAVSFLVRTAVRTVETRKTLDIRYSAPEAGTVYFEILRIPDAEKEWLSGISDTVRRGLRDISLEAPDEVIVEEERSN